MTSNSVDRFSTTLSKFGLATSLKCDGETYLLSTVVRAGYFETILFGTMNGSGRNMLCNSQTDTQMQAVLCHIELAKKLIATPPCRDASLAWFGMSSFNMSHESSKPNSISQWREPHFILLLEDANINYHEPKKSIFIYFIGIISIGLLWYSLSK